MFSFGVLCLKDNRFQSFLIEIAKIKPIRPRLPELSVKVPDLRDHVNLPGVVVPAVHDKDHAVHHLPQAAAGRQFVQPVHAEKMRKIPTLDFAAE